MRRRKGIKDQGGGMGRWVVGGGGEVTEGEAEQNKVNKLVITEGCLGK